ncbi:MAG: TIGR03545 family protein [Elusimicrobia bacterium]|nr:TIGR03545 family protein [Elusimicrobiota bacterium]
MNKGYLIPRIILVLLVWAFFYFAFDPLLKWGAIKSLESVFEAKVEIGKIKTSFLNPSLEVYSFKAGDSNNEYRNLFEFEKLKFLLNGKQLLEKKFVIEEGSVKGLNFATLRKTSCKIKITKTEMPEFLKEYASQAQTLALDNLNQAKEETISDIKTDISQLETIKLLNEINSKYEKEYSETVAKADFSYYEKQINEINARYEKIKSQKDFLKQAKEFPKLKKEIDELLDKYKEDKRMLSLAIKDISYYSREINEAKKRDLEKLSSMAKLPSADKEQIAKMLIGKDIYEKFYKIFSYSKQAVKYIPDNPKKKIFEEKRKRGRIVHFPKLENYPSFLLKTASVSGIFTPENPIEYLGAVYNISSNPSIWKKPVEAEIKGSKDIRSLNFKFQARLWEKPYETETYFSYKGAEISDKKFGSGNMQISLNKALTDSSLQIKTKGGELDGLWETYFKDADISSGFDNIKYEPLRNSLKKSIESAKVFSVQAYIKGDFSKPKISVKTDLADIIAQSVKKAFGEEAEKARKKLEAALDEKIKAQKEKTEKIISENKEKLEKILKENEEKLNKWKKEINDKFKDSATKNLPKIKL